ncbi:MAG: hypothetical protein IPL87_03630 [Candidatus Moraniibacteriota bacterium]|nr:MAG: hypothetical protein IPL87_03630 [Candidatus Moranbacteria bacterium]
MNQISPPTLSPRSKRLLFVGRIILGIVFLSSLALFSWSVLFPPQPLFFDFRDAKLSVSTLKNPRTFPPPFSPGGQFRDQDILTLDASAFGEYTTLALQFTALKNSPLGKGRVSVRRSQQAHFFPEGSGASFPPGTLLQENGSFYQIAPDGRRKKFPSKESAERLGFRPETFLPVRNEDLSLNQDGGLLEWEPSALPEGTFVHADNTYYEWRSGTLLPFVSENAFRARFRDEWAIKKDAAFVRLVPLSENWRSFPSGTLLSWGDGVFLMDQTSPRPILGVDIFLSLGYSWEDVVPANDEEISLEQKGRSVDFSAAHPDGTVFHETDTNRFFLILNKTKHELRGDAIRNFWLGTRKPIAVSSQSLTTSATCDLSVHSFLFFAPTLECRLPLEALAKFRGDTYELRTTFLGASAFERLDVSFEAAVKKETLLTRLSKLKNRVLARYLPTAEP